MSAPLQSLTESALKAQPKRQAQRGKTKRVPNYQRPSGKKQTIKFDEDARREYLTGFSKRKTQRKQAAHNHVQQLIREEIRNSRLAAAQARKERAAENVRAERIAYGLESEGEDYEDQDEESANETDIKDEREFETDEQRAHVTVEALDMDDIVQPFLNKPSTLPKKVKATKAATVPTSAPAQHNPRVPSGSLTGILEPEVAHAAMSDEIFHNTPMNSAPDKSSKKVSYMSKAERKEERQKQRAWNHAQAEMRRAENRSKHAKKRRP